jgi:bifunctional DNA-binding transcriptional regulator/antitoxin component of YhaV-PrlF toxin-antitoxin module
MLLTLTAKRQVTFPAQVLQSLGAGVGDKIELIPSPEGFLLKTRLVDRSRLGVLRSKITANAADFDLQQFRESRYDRSLRD